jgi:hypothetical protein
MSAHRCIHTDCRNTVSHRELFCLACLRLVTEPTRAALARSWRPDDAPSKRVLAAIARARGEITYARANGHRVPMDQSLQFDPVNVHAKDRVGS